MKEQLPSIPTVVTTRASYHFILTRFNLRLWWRYDKRGGAIQTSEWLDERFRLFERYCLPSVISQTMQDFTWLCLFDGGTPESCKLRVEGYKSSCPQLMPCYLNSAETRHFQQYFQRKVYDMVMMKVGNESSHKDVMVLTTYLDNDDSLRSDFLETVQRIASCEPFGTVISFKYGLQYYSQWNIAVRVPYANNHFLTFSEPLRPGLKTIWGFWHFSIYKYKGIRVKTVNSPDKPMWIETIHDGNIDNDVKMTINQCLITDCSLIRQFGLEFNLQPVCKAILVFLTKFPIRAFRQIVRRIGNKLSNR